MIFSRSTNPHTCTLTESGLVHSLVHSLLSGTKERFYSAKDIVYSCPIPYVHVCFFLSPDFNQCTKNVFVTWLQSVYKKMFLSPDCSQCTKNIFVTWLQSVYNFTTYIFWIDQCTKMFCQPMFHWFSTIIKCEYEPSMSGSTSCIWSCGRYGICDMGELQNLTKQLQMVVKL